MASTNDVLADAAERPRGSDFARLTRELKAAGTCDPLMLAGVVGAWTSSSKTPSSTAACPA